MSTPLSIAARAAALSLLIAPLSPHVSADGFAPRVLGGSNLSPWSEDALGPGEAAVEMQGISIDVDLAPTHATVITTWDLRPGADIEGQLLGLPVERATLRLAPLQDLKIEVDGALVEAREVDAWICAPAPGATPFTPWTTLDREADCGGLMVTNRWLVFPVDFVDRQDVEIRLGYRQPNVDLVWGDGAEVLFSYSLWASGWAGGELARVEAEVRLRGAEGGTIQRTSEGAERGDGDVTRWRVEDLAWSHPAEDTAARMQRLREAREAGDEAALEALRASLGERRRDATQPLQLALQVDALAPRSEPSAAYFDGTSVRMIRMQDHAIRFMVPASEPTTEDWAVFFSALRSESRQKESEASQRWARVAMYELREWLAEQSEPSEGATWAAEWLTIDEAEGMVPDEGEVALRDLASFPPAFGTDAAVAAAEIRRQRYQWFMWAWAGAFVLVVGGMFWFFRGLERSRGEG